MRKKIFGLISMLFLIGFLVACGNSDDAGSEESGNGDTADQADSVELKVFIAQPRFKEQYESYLDQFAQKYEEENKVSVSFQLEMPGANEAAQILQTRLSSNDSPDVFMVHAINEIPLFDKAGYLEDLSDQPFVDNLLEAPLEAVTHDDKVLAVPLETLHWGYLYNKDIFNELEIELPQTLSEMEAVVSTLEENDVTPFISAYKDSYVPQLYLPLEVGGLMATDNPDFVEKMNNDEGSFSDLEGFFNIMDLQNAHGTERPFETDADQGSNKFANGEAAMWVQGPWMAETILKANEDFNFGVAPLPINENEAATLINSSVSTSLAVSSDSPNKEVAKALVNYILDEEDSDELFQALKFNPVAKSHSYDPFPWLEEAMEFVNEGKAYQDPAIPSSVKAESEKLLQTYLGGSAEQADILKGLDRAWEQANKVNN